jgi:hypothetical protein
MSQENVEVVRRIYDDFLGRGMLPLDLTHPEVRIDNIPQSPIPGPYFGHQGARQWWADLEEAAPGLRLNAEEVIDAGEDRVIGVLRLHVARSGLVDQMPAWAAIHWIRNGLLVRVAGYLTKEEALGAVGLSD